jgi:NADPH:quinone reductase-like Zn-dependent oxidoreductase
VLLGGCGQYVSLVRAVVQDSYDSPDALEVREVPTPVAGQGEVLVRVRAASVHPDVWHVVTGRPYVLRLMGAGLRRPGNRIPGTDVAGHVVAVGAGARRFRPGDEVFGETTMGHQWLNGGAFAEYVSAPQNALARKPGGVTFEQAAAVPTAGLIALHNLPRKHLRPGQRVLVNGAGGGVGGFAVQLAKARGATVTGVDTAMKLPVVTSLGADRVIDYAREDFTRAGERYDLIFDVPGNHSFAQCRRVLAPGGTYVWIGHDRFGAAAGRWLGSVPRGLGLIVMSPFVPQLPAVTFARPGKKDSMAVLAGLLEAGKLTPVVARTFPLAGAAQALRYLQEGQAQGRIVLTV